MAPDLPSCHRARTYTSALGAATSERWLEWFAVSRAGCIDRLLVEPLAGGRRRGLRHGVRCVRIVMPPRVLPGRGPHVIGGRRVPPGRKYRGGLMAVRRVNEVIRTDGMVNDRPGPGAVPATQLRPTFSVGPIRKHPARTLRGMAKIEGSVAATPGRAFGSGFSITWTGVLLRSSLTQCPVWPISSRTACQQGAVSGKDGLWPLRESSLAFRAGQRARMRLSGPSPGADIKRPWPG